MSMSVPENKIMHSSHDPSSNRQNIMLETKYGNTYFVVSELTLRVNLLILIASQYYQIAALRSLNFNKYDSLHEKRATRF